MTLDKWVPFRNEGAAVRCRVFCFPHAAGNAAFYRPLRSFMPPEIDFCPVELPGRAARLEEGTSDAEVGEHESLVALTLLVRGQALEQHVRRLEVSVHDAQRVRDRQAVGDVEAGLYCFRDMEREAIHRDDPALAGTQHDLEVAHPQGRGSWDGRRRGHLRAAP